MRKLLLLTLLITTIFSYAQVDTPGVRKDRTATIKPDSTDDRLKKFQDSVTEQVTIENSGYNAEQNTRNLESLMRSMDERRAKEKKAAMIRIGIGVLFLALLVFGLLRRR